MVRSDIACSGVMFTLDTESGFREAVVINGAWGFGRSGRRNGDARQWSFQADF